MTNTQHPKRQVLLVSNPALDKAAAQYRRAAAAARRRADRSQSDAEYNAAIAALHAANERYEAAKLANPNQYKEVSA